MLDIGWQEFTLVAFILLIIVGPKDLPRVLKSIFKFIDKIKKFESKPFIVSNFLDKEEVILFQDLYETLPIEIDNKRQKIII